MPRRRCAAPHRPPNPPPPPPPRARGPCGGRLPRARPGMSSRGTERRRGGWDARVRWGWGRYARSGAAPNGEGLTMRGGDLLSPPPLFYVLRSPVAAADADPAAPGSATPGQAAAERGRGRGPAGYDDAGDGLRYGQCDHARG